MKKKLLIALLCALPLLCTMPCLAVENCQNAPTSENELLKLRTELSTTKSVKVQKELLRHTGQTGLFQAMIAAGEHVGNKQTGSVAARVVADVALANAAEYDGEAMRGLLRKALPMLSGNRRKAVKKLLAAKSNGKGFVSMFNGKDLTGWKGLVENPIARAKMSEQQLAEAQVKADENMRRDWKVEDGMLVYVGSGFDNLCTVEQYGDFEMYVDWRLDPAGKEPDAGVYLRGTPQVQIWDIARVNVGAQVGSGGLYNNKKNVSIPKCVADNKLGEWNSFYIKMVGDKVTVKLNGVLVVDGVTLENYWDRSQPIFPVEQIELQAHGSRVWWRNLYIKRL